MAPQASGHRAEPCANRNNLFGSPSTTSWKRSFDLASGILKYRRASIWTARQQRSWAVSGEAGRYNVVVVARTPYTPRSNPQRRGRLIKIPIRKGESSGLASWPSARSRLAVDVCSWCHGDFRKMVPGPRRAARRSPFPDLMRVAEPARVHNRNVVVAPLPIRSR